MIGYYVETKRLWNCFNLYFLCTVLNILAVCSLLDITTIYFYKSIESEKVLGTFLEQTFRKCLEDASGTSPFANQHSRWITLSGAVLLCRTLLNAFLLPSKFYSIVFISRFFFFRVRQVYCLSFLRANIPEIIIFKIVSISTNNRK